MSATTRSHELEALARRIAAALPPVVVEVVLTGSVSRGVADELSDIEMLVVTSETLPLETCFEHAAAAGLTSLDTWGSQGGPASRVFGYCEGTPIELIWWSREHAEASVAGLGKGEGLGSADALVHGVPLRTCGLLARWQEELREVPPALTAARIEDAALTWGGFAPEGFLTITRPGERLALLERVFDDAGRVLQIVYALNGVWQPSSKRLASRAEGLAMKPERLAERIEDALTEANPFRAVLVMTELQLDTLALAPSGPNVDRARAWLARVAEVVRPGAG